MKHRQEEYWKPRFHAPPLQSHPDPQSVIQCSWYPHEGQCPYLRLAPNGSALCRMNGTLANVDELDWLFKMKTKSARCIITGDVAGKPFSCRIPAI